jgi:N-acyl-D-amino-acid deacylase
VGRLLTWRAHACLFWPVAIRHFHPKDLPMFDLIFRNGTVVDGTGAERRVADVAVKNGLVAKVAPKMAETAPREVDATGLVVAPGWVDIRTHYDGQVTWDDELGPSAWHGVTTLVMGNCGVGFAPVKPDKHDWLIALMEGVEDIPGSALAEGIAWEWESFPEYLACR